MPTKIKVYNQKCEPVSEIKLSDQVFGVEISEALVHQALVAQTSNERLVLAHTKERSEVRGGGKKPWRQKGTGRARAGSIRSPIWKGGGVTFGPRKDRNFKKNINKKMKQKAMLMVLSDRAVSKNLVVLDKLEMNEFKTKVFNEMLRDFEKKVLRVKRQEDKEVKEQKNNLPEQAGKAGKQGIKEKNGQENKKGKKVKRSILFVNDKANDKARYSGRNLTGVKIINLDNINILDLLKYRDLVMTMKVVKKLEEKYK